MAIPHPHFSDIQAIPNGGAAPTLSDAERALVRLLAEVAVERHLGEESEQ